MKGSFVSVWNDGEIVITTHATLNQKTGSVTTKLVDVGFDANLTREYFTANGVEFDVCKKCHEYIVKEDGSCYNKNCDK